MFKPAPDNPWEVSRSRLSKGRAKQDTQTDTQTDETERIIRPHLRVVTIRIRRLHLTYSTKVNPSACRHDVWFRALDWWDLYRMVWLVILTRCISDTTFDLVRDDVPDVVAGTHGPYTISAAYIELCNSVCLAYSGSNNSKAQCLWRSRRTQEFVTTDQTAAVKQWRRENFYLGEYSPGDLGLAATPQYGILGETGVVSRHCTETIKNLIFLQNSPPDSWPVCFTVGINPFNASCSKLLLFEGFSAILV